MRRFIPEYGTIMCQLSEEDNADFFPRYQAFSAEINGFRKMQKVIVKPSQEIVQHIEVLAGAFEKKRYEIWDPLNKQYGLPWRTDVYILPNYDGILYVAKSFVPEDNEYSYYKGAEPMKNVNENKPADGTLVGTLTEEEIKALMDIDALDAALQNITISVSAVQEFDKFLDRFQELEKRRRSVIVPIFKRLKISMAWELTFDYSLGGIYVINYNEPYESYEEEV
ncbi:hypothetical protein LRR81_07725 [Metabacillus sp. GX 13764]|uniref:hypothetical protein n=1 Tax=Metabacillus kandeliae TaxID=2900151 RepID=UPI001E4B2311|nr:hypothetical protein [Metabacillus kandeliae]MCD7034119.1 hypothetical protein [Metabacillus kandeliae]